MILIGQNLNKKDRVILAMALAFIILQVWLDLKMPDYMAKITRLISVQGSSMGEVLWAGGQMVACALGSLALSICVTVAAARISADFSASVRERLFDRVQSFSLREIHHFSTASLITRTTNDVTQVERLIVLGLQVMIKAPILAVWAILKIAGKDWHWTAATAAAVVILMAIVGLVVGLCVPRFRRVQQLTDDLNRVTRENLTGLKVVRAYNAESYQEAKFEQVNGALTANQLFTSRGMSFLLPGIMLVMNGLTLAIYWIGAGLIQQAGLVQKMSLFSDMIVFMSYAMQVIMAFMMMVMIFIIYPRSSVAAKRIRQVLETKTALEDGGESEGAGGAWGEVEFRHVSFRYPDAGEDVLTDISFTAGAGETVALIGSTGSGKSTLVGLIPRLYEATEGEVLVDGRDVREYDQRSLHNKIGYVTQTAVLFSGTVSGNIAYGDNGRAPAGPEAIRQAARTAAADEFIDGLENGYESYVSQGGGNLSGGQRQRLAIARAVARDPEILIFDDSFSALDYRTDRIVRRRLQEKCQKTTRIIVAQRIGTIRDADKILVLDEGKIVGRGTHRELMRSCQVYQQIALSQLSKEELEA